jgi:hypothetical protein
MWCSFQVFDVLILEVANVLTISALSILWPPLRTSHKELGFALVPKLTITSVI